jgi:hypothetical protein
MVRSTCARTTRGHGGTVVAPQDGMSTTAITADQPNLPASQRPIVYWHRQLPPLEAELLGEHVLEATSGRVQGTLAHRDELWDRCYRELIANTEARFAQEAARLGGHYAHVLDESIHIGRDDIAGEAWLQGRFTYVLYRRGATDRVR